MSATPVTPLLQSIQILVTGVLETEKRRLHTLAKSQGAVILSTANANDPPHVVITRMVGSPRYFTILRRNSNTPVVTPEWLSASVEQGTRLPYADYAAGVFQGLVICFSGLPISEKQELGDRVVIQGGKHSLSLDRQCTHLVTDSTESQKFIYAQHHGIICVTPSWVEDSLGAGRCLEPAKYIIAKPSQQQLQQQQQQQQQRSSAAPNGTAATTTAGGNNTSNGGGSGGAPASVAVVPSVEHHGDGGDAVHGEANENVEARGNGSQVIAAAAAAPSIIADDDVQIPDTDNGGAAAEKLGSGALLATAINRTSTTTSAPPPQPPSVQLPQQPQQQPWMRLDCDQDASLSLESCYISLVACTSAEEQETLELCTKGGAKRFLEPHPQLTTHVVVGSSAAAAPLSAEHAEVLGKMVTERRDVAVVSMEWLRRSVARRQVLPPDERFTVPLPLLPSASTHLMSAKPLTNTAAAAALLHQDSGSLPPFSAAVLDGNNNNNNYNNLNSSSQDNGRFAPLQRQPSGASHLGGFLDTCYFTLAAVRGLPEETEAERIIRSHGGRMFSASLPSNGRTCFAICPYSLPPSTLHALRNGHPDFAAVPPENRFTMYWLECSVKAQKVLTPQAGAPCFQPLPYALPIPGMDKISYVAMLYCIAFYVLHFLLRSNILTNILTPIRFFIFVIQDFHLRLRAHYS